MTEATGSWVEARPLDRRIVVVWTVQEAAGFGVLAVAVLEANGSGVALFPNENGGPIPVDDPMRHVGFRTSRRGLELAKAELLANGTEFHEGDYGVAWSVYLPDPDGYQVEITTYEPA